MFLYTSIIQLFWYVSVIVNGLGKEANDPVVYMENSYSAGETDEFIKPMLFDKNGIINNPITNIINDIIR